jgi:hypothetical protein
MTNLCENLLDHYENLKMGLPLPTSLISSKEKEPAKEEKCLSRRVCHAARMMLPLPPCRNPSCGSSDILEDANEGCVVCIQCGLIQTSSVLESAATQNAIFHQGVSPIAVHRYSRIVVIRGILKSLKGETRVDLSFQETTALLGFFPDDAPPQNATQVKTAITKLKLPPRLLHHSTTLLGLLWKSESRKGPPSLDESEVKKALILFRALENVWDRAPLDGYVREGRKKFLSLPLVWNFICDKLGFIEMGKIMESGTIKNPKNRAWQMAKLELLYGRWSQ